MSWNVLFILYMIYPSFELVSHGFLPSSCYPHIPTLQFTFTTVHSFSAKNKRYKKKEYFLKNIGIKKDKTIKRTVTPFWITGWLRWSSFLTRPSFGKLFGPLWLRFVLFRFAISRLPNDSCALSLLQQKTLVGVLRASDVLAVSARTL